MAKINDKLERTVIIVSSGRTGTKALAHCFDACYDQVRALHEPRPSQKLRFTSIRSLSGRVPKDKLIAILFKCRRDLLASIDQPVYIESNPMLQGFTDAFAEVFHNVRVVHVVRDPRSFVRSSMNFGTFRGIKGVLARCVPYWLPRPEHFKPNPPRTWRQMRPPERMAWFWSVVNNELNRGETAMGERYRRVRYEDLFAPDGSALRGLTDWIGLPPTDRLAELVRTRTLNASRNRGFPRWADWTDQDRQAVLDHCGDLMRQYGYDHETAADDRP